MSTVKNENDVCSACGDLECLRDRRALDSCTLVAAFFKLVALNELAEHRTEMLGDKLKQSMDEVRRYREEHEAHIQHHAGTWCLGCGANLPPHHEGCVYLRLETAERKAREALAGYEAMLPHMAIKEAELKTLKKKLDTAAKAFQDIGNINGAPVMSYHQSTAIMEYSRKEVEINSIVAHTLAEITADKEKSDAPGE